MKSNARALAGIAAAGLFALTAGLAAPAYAQSPESSTASSAVAASAAANASAASATATARNGFKSTVSDRVENFPGVPESGSRVAMTLDSQGNIYYATMGPWENYVYRVSPTGIRKIYYIYSPEKIIGIRGITAGANGTLYILIQLVDSNNQVTEWWYSANTNSGGFSPGQDLGPIDQTNIPYWSTAYDPATGAISFVTGNTVKSFVPGTDPNAIPSETVVAGTGNAGFSGDGGPATSAQLNGPEGIAYDNQGNLYIADTGNNRVREVTTNGVINTIGGNGSAGYSGDGSPGTQASLNGPSSVATDVAGNVYIADTGNDRVRVLDNYRTITTVIGSGVGDPLAPGTPAPAASLHAPWWVAVSGNGTVVFESRSRQYATGYQAYQAGPLPEVDVLTNPLPSDITSAGTSGFMHRRDGGPGAPVSFNLTNSIMLNPSTDGTSYSTGPLTLVTQTAGGSPVTITAQSATYTVTNPIEFSNLLLLNNVTFSHTVDGVTYTSTIPNLSFAYERGYGLSYIATTPPSPMSWGDLVIPDLKDGSGAVAPDNANIAGAWILQAGFTVVPVYSN